MHLSIRLLLGSITLWAASGCEKPEIRDIAAQEKKWVGTWQVAEIKTVVTDTLGHQLSATTVTGQGTVEFRLAAGGTGGDAFKPAVFEGACVQSELVQYFARKPAGDRTATNGWQLYWDADPDGARLQVWGIGPLSSYHRTETSDSNNDSPRQLFYAYRPASFGPPPNLVVLVTWQLRK